MVDGERTAAVAAHALESELMAIEGVASAEVADVSGEVPTGVRVRLEPDADAHRVGIEVQRVLAAHGMRSRFATEAPEAAPSDPGPHQPPDVPPPTVPPPPTQRPPVPPPAPEPPPPAAAAEVPPTDRPSPAASPRIPTVQAVAVEERSDGLTLRVTLDDGRSAQREVAADDDGLEAAVIGAVAEAVGERVTRAAVEWIELEDGTVVTVVLRRADESLTAGAGVMRVGRAFALAIAARAALSA